MTRLTRVETGVQYLHRDLASRRRRRKGKSQIWDSKIWSRVPRDSHPRKTALARASSMFKRQIHPLVREGAPQKQDRICQTVINIWSWDSRWGSTPRLTDWLTDWPSVAMWLWLWLWLWDELLTRVEAGSNTSIVTLRIVGGDEKGSLKSETAN
jgi:hypothetical protein